jgi:DNA end-binding protein Ku
LPKPAAKSKRTSKSKARAPTKRASHSKSGAKSRPNAKEQAEVTEETSGPRVRSFWSGTITFGLVSIPVDLLSAVRSRQTALKLIDTEGNALGRPYHCTKDGKKLDNEDLVRGYETDDGELVVISDEEFASVAPEMSPDINLRNFVPADQIPPVYCEKPYFLAPAGKSAKAYNLLAATMQRTGKVGIGSFVMRAHEYLVAIVSDNGVLRADTLRYADEIRTPESIGLPKRVKPQPKLVSQFIQAMDELKRDELSMAELEDREAEELQELVKKKQKDKGSVIHQPELEAEDADAAESGAQIIDLMAVLRRSLSKRAVVTNAESSPPISLDERRALKQRAATQFHEEAVNDKKSDAKKSVKKKPSVRKSRKRAS